MHYNVHCDYYFFCTIRDFDSICNLSSIVWLRFINNESRTINGKALTMFSSSASSSDMPSITSSVHVIKTLHSDNLYLLSSDDSMPKSPFLGIVGQEFRQNDTNSTQFVHINLETYFHLCMSRLATPINVPVSMSRITLAMSPTRLQSYATSLTAYQLPSYLHAQTSLKCTCPMTLCLRALLLRRANTFIS